WRILPHSELDLCAASQQTYPADVCCGSKGVGPAPVARYSYVVLVKVMLSSVTVAGPTGTCTGLTIFKNWILSVHTFLRKSSKTLIVNCSPGQRRYPKPNGANPAWSHTGTGLPSTTP